jgi:putative endonuclease
MANTRRHVLGKYGESVAADFLSRQGYEIVERNWHCRDGEIDLIARENDDWVFVEVKTRSSKSSVDGLEAVDELKLKKLRKSIAQWCSVRQIVTTRLRLDVVSVFVNAGTVRFEHLKQVF